VTAGSLGRLCFILIPQSALPLPIQDKNRMRFYEKVIKVVPADEWVIVP
jgi:hypothetical protein